MQVELLGSTPFAKEVIYSAGRQCYSKKTAKELYNNMWLNTGEREAERFIKKLIKNGHLSPLEHVSFTFSVEGISRACSHQLVRHRLASYSQQSQRYINHDGFDYVLPDSIAVHQMAKLDYKEIMAQLDTLYKKLIDYGIPKEDARYLLPNACCTNIVVTMNCRELLHFFKLRLHKSAQWEIRQLAESMLNLCKNVLPCVFE